MRSLDEINTQELAWVKPRWLKREYELRAGDEVAATLVRSRGSSAIGEWSGGRYRFIQKGWFRPQILVRSEPPADAEAPLATFAARDGVLILADGRALAWTKPSIWRSRRVWMDGTTELVAFDPASGYSTPHVTITAEGGRDPELPLLLLLGEYLIVRAREDADAASVAATTTVVASS